MQETEKTLMRHFISKSLDPFLGHGLLCQGDRDLLLPPVLPVPCP